MFINGAEYWLKDSSGHGDATRVRYLVGTNTFYEVGKPFGLSAPASGFGKHFTVELVHEDSTPTVSGKPNAVISGNFINVDRSVLKEMLTSLGYNVTGSVNAKTSLIVVGDNAGSKLAKAVELRIDVVTADWVMNKWSEVNPQPLVQQVGRANRASPRNKYDREIVPGVYVDVYDVLGAFTTGSAAIDHAVKKLLAPGQRGVKDRVTDLEEAVSSIQREIERLGEWGDKQ